VRTVRDLLIQRAARLQEWPALTAPGWGTLRYPAWRNRVEGVGLGLMADAAPVGSACFSATGGPGDWAAEVACACCGLVWDPAGTRVPAAILGGPDFNSEDGRQPYHDREHDLDADTPLAGGLDHAELLLRLARLNRALGWDHTTEVRLPLAGLATPEVRAALWSALYAGAHAVLQTAPADWQGEAFRGIFQ
jgi:hypothetical protein